MDQNLVSIIIATKNGAKYLPRAVASIDKQTEKNTEIIIVSDGSTDNTVEVAQELAKSRPNLKVIKLEPNVGPGQARNVGVEHATGQFIALLDDDDEWLDAEKLSNQTSAFNRNPDLVLVGASETEFVSEAGKFQFMYRPRLLDKNIRDRLLVKNQFTTSSVMFRKLAFQKVGGFAAMYLAEDYDLWLRLAQVGKIANIAGCKTRHYVRGSGAQQANRTEMNKIVLRLVKKYKRNFSYYWLALPVAYARVIFR